MKRDKERFTAFNFISRKKLGAYEAVDTSFIYKRRIL